MNRAILRLGGILGRGMGVAALGLVLSFGAQSMAQVEKESPSAAARMKKALKKLNPVTAIQNARIKGLVKEQTEVNAKLKGAKMAESVGAGSAERIKHLEAKSAAVADKIAKTPLVKKLAKVESKLAGAKMADANSERAKHLEAKKTSIAAKLEKMAPGFEKARTAPPKGDNAHKPMVRRK